MTFFSPLDEIASARNRFTTFHLLDFRAFDLESAHFELGRAVRPQVERIIQHKLDTWGAEGFLERIRIAQAVLNTLVEKTVSNRLNPLISQVLRAYLRCLEQWVAGTDLRAVLARSTIVTPADRLTDQTPLLVGMVLQNDALGCQTGTYRQADGSVVLWHTEEDSDLDGLRFDKLRLMRFRSPWGPAGAEVVSFIYPDLLPGPAFSWRSDGYIQAVDFLYMREMDLDHALLANIACWVTLVLDQPGSLEAVVRQLGPYLDGYAITGVSRDDKMVQARKIEFLAADYLYSELGQQKDAYSFQVNLVSDPASRLAEHCEDKTLASRGLLESRLSRTHRLLGSKAIDLNHLEGFSRLVSSRAGGGYAYSNQHVKAHLVGQVSDTGMIIQVGPGPAVRDHRPLLEFIY
ncbi:MAG: hypothetical protein MUE67_04035 [Anaerolineales bacterium]|jgi:hypothetical protein|nr:hypothetical protein [Anaerolineales bacterium]